MVNERPKMNICHMNEFCWNILPKSLQACFTFGLALNPDTTCGRLPI